MNINNFYSNFLNFFLNPTSTKDIIEIRNYYKEEKHFEKAEIFKEIENANKIENISNNFVN
jgi:hypothetical protein